MTEPNASPTYHQCNTKNILMDYNEPPIDSNQKMKKLSPKKIFLRVMFVNYFFLEKISLEIYKCQLRYDYFCTKLNALLFRSVFQKEKFHSSNDSTHKSLSQEIKGHRF